MVMLDSALMPVIKISIMVVAKLTRSWWMNQVPEVQQEYKKLAKDKQNIIWYSGATMLGLFGTYLLCHTEKDPVTGRRRLYLLNDVVLEEMADQNVDQIFEHFTKKCLVDTNDPVYTRVSKLTLKLVTANEEIDAIRNRKWHLVVVKNPQVVGQ